MKKLISILLTLAVGLLSFVTDFHHHKHRNHQHDGVEFIENDYCDLCDMIKHKPNPLLIINNINLVNQTFYTFSDNSSKKIFSKIISTIGRSPPSIS